MHIAEVVLLGIMPNFLCPMTGLFVLGSSEYTDLNTHLPHYRYLQNGNILAARTFLSHLVSQLIATRSNFVAPLQSSPIVIGKTDGGAPDEITLTTDPMVNFAQLAVRTCQRAQLDKNKTIREAWIRLCGTYQSKGGLLATKEIRKVSSMLRVELYPRV